jgi:hypothetical protein
MAPVTLAFRSFSFFDEFTVGHDQSVAAFGALHGTLARVASQILALAHHVNQCSVPGFGEGGGR